MDNSRSSQIVLRFIASFVFLRTAAIKAEAATGNKEICRARMRQQGQAGRAILLTLAIAVFFFQKMLLTNKHRAATPGRSLTFPVIDSFVLYRLGSRARPRNANPPLSVLARDGLSCPNNPALAFDLDEGRGQGVGSHQH